ncbi:MAG: hypothetical protein H8E47_12715 [Anaerolineales bacterium]|nr:hypothetical protein [Anaerolineales bacterium]
MEQTKTSLFQQVLDVVDKLSPEDQETLAELIRRRLIEWRRAEIACNAAATLQAVREGHVGYGMVSLIESLPKTGRLEVDIKVAADIHISAYAARQKVNDFVLSDISYMLHAGDSTLVVGRRICWRVPVILSLTSRGDVGEVGAIDVDVENGQMYVTPQLIAEINARAEGLALSAASAATE